MVFELVLALILILLTSFGFIVLYKFHYHSKQHQHINIPFFPLHSTLKSVLNIKFFPEYYYQFWEQNKYPGLYAGWFVGKTTYFVSDPDAAQWLLTLREDCIVKYSFIPKSIKKLFDQNLVSVNGDAWRRQRQVYNPAFSKSSYQNYYTYFYSTVDKGLALLHEKAKTGEDFDFTPFLSSFTIDILGLSIFGYDFNSLQGKLGEYYKAYRTVFSLDRMRLILDFFPWLDNSLNPYSVKLRSASVKLNELLNKLIEERTKNPKDDMLTHLLEASRGQSDVTLSEQELRANVFILFLAGHETTASALSWTMIELAQHPEVQQNIRKEIETVLGDNKAPTIEDLEKLHYLDNVIKESMRRHPPIPILLPRHSIQDLRYKDIDIPKGSFISLNIFNIHHHPHYWDDPFKFNPDRWNEEKSTRRYVYLPFSLGPRMCIGNNFSLIEQRIFLFKLMKEFDLGLPSKHKLSLIRGNGLNTPRNAWVSLKPIITTTTKT